MAVKGDEIIGMMEQMMEKWEDLHPDTELVVLSLPKNDPVQRRRILEEMARILPEQGTK